MPSPNVLSIPCSKCKISETCPRKGSSPLQRGGRAVPLFCRIVGGYATGPIDPERLSDEGKARAAKDGPCMSIAEVPTAEPSGHIHFEMVKVFHHAIVHPRSTTTLHADAMLTSSHTRERPNRS
jgi:hypothetical protein